MLQQTYFKVAKVTMEYSEAQEKYDDTLEVGKTCIIYWLFVTSLLIGQL